MSAALLLAGCAIDPVASSYDEGEGQDRTLLDTWPAQLPPPCVASACTAVRISRKASVGSAPCSG